MDNIRGMRVFVEVVRCGSFVAAAGRLNMSASAASRRVQELEQDLGQSLLRRTTRNLSLTDAGERYFENCRDIVSAVDQLERSARDSASSPRGVVHVSAGRHFAREKLAPLMPEFLEKYPELRMHLHLDERPVDMIGEGVDLAFRMGSAQMGADQSDSGRVERRIGRIPIWLVASPAFLERHGQPETLQDISRFPCLVDTVPAFRDRWPLGPTIPVQGPVIANDGGAIGAMAEAGLGLALLPQFFVERAAADGRLVRLMEDQLDFVIDLKAIFPGRLQITAAARAVADFVKDAFEAGGLNACSPASTSYRCAQPLPLVP